MLELIHFYIFNIRISGKLPVECHVSLYYREFTEFLFYIFNIRI